MVIEFLDNVSSWNFLRVPIYCFFFFFFDKGYVSPKTLSCLADVLFMFFPSDSTATGVREQKLLSKSATRKTFKQLMGILAIHWEAKRLNSVVLRIAESWHLQGKRSSKCNKQTTSYINTRKQCRKKSIWRAVLEIGCTTWEKS